MRCKKILGLILMISLLQIFSTCFTANASITSQESDFSFDKNSGAITGYQGSGGEVIIPDTISGISVKTIGKDAFSYCNKITRVTIPNSVTTIDKDAFYGCYGLTNITIPDSVTAIGFLAFYNCGSLKNITIPSSVSSIDISAFGGCISMTDINVDANNSCYSSQEGVLFNKNNSQLLIYPEGRYGNYIIPSSVTTIGIEAFSGCRGLTSITIPKNVTTISNEAFSGCSGLTSITIPSSITTINYATFDYCIRLANVTIPNSVTTIGSSAFYNCSGLTSITIPSSVTTIEFGAFNDCSSLTSIAIPSSVTEINDSVFAGCSKLKSITVPNSITTIGKDAFNGCSSLANITIPSNVSSIKDGAFYGCLSLTSIVIPNGVTTINTNTFYGCNGITSITIPDSVTSINEAAFYGCSKLTGITIPNSVTTIGNDAFDSCCGLISITIPNSVTTIDYYAFRYCTSLNSITIPSSVTTIGNGAFYYCCSLKSIIIPSSITTISSYTFYGCQGLTNITIPNSVTSIGDFAFSGCHALSSITIPSSIISIGNWAFNDCSNLTSAIFKGNAPELIGWVFDNTSSNFTVFYYPGSTGFTNPWHRYPTVIYVPANLTAIASISGKAQVGSTLTAGSLSPSGALASYQWMESDSETGTYTNITGAKGITYTPNPADIGRYLEVAATGIGSYSGTVVSTAVYIGIYSINVGTTTGGSIISNSLKAGMGMRINLFIIPDAGMQLIAGSLKYNDGTSDNLINGTSFIMPNANVTVTGEFEPIIVNGIISGCISTPSSNHENSCSQVKITVEGTNLTTTSTIDGSYVISNVPEGNYAISFSKENYVTQRAVNIHVTAGATTNINELMILKGDINCDGGVNETDYDLVKRYLLSINTNFPTITGVSAADIDVDGKITSRDLVLIRKLMTRSEVK